MLFAADKVNVASVPEVFEIAETTLMSPADVPDAPVCTVMLVPELRALVIVATWMLEMSKLGVYVVVPPEEDVVKLLSNVLAMVRL